MEKNEPEIFHVTPDLFNEWRVPRVGKSNPEEIHSNVWAWLINSKLSGYAASEKMSGSSSYEDGPTWSFDRFGQSRTELPDGRIVFIGGEHEDHYDPDFYIYNDVVVEAQDGNVKVYCYRLSEFPQTDFHSATLVGSAIYIIGCLGYPEQRAFTKTPVYMLNLENFEISEIKTKGDCPGWIHGHSAKLTEDQKYILIKDGLIDTGPKNYLKENFDDWVLELETNNWSRLTQRNWVHLEFTRKDGKNNKIFELRSAFWSKSVKWQKQYETDLERLQKAMGFTPDVDLVSDLYNFKLDGRASPVFKEDYNLYTLYLDGVKIKICEESFRITLLVEGQLDPKIIDSMKAELLVNLGEIEKVKWIVNEI